MSPPPKLRIKEVNWDDIVRYCLIKKINCNQLVPYWPTTNRPTITSKQLTKKRLPSNF